MENNPRIPFAMMTARSKVTKPNGKRVIVHVVINLEVWPFDQKMPRAILVNPHGKDPLPDIGNFSWVEYGLRYGVPRLIRAIGERGIPCSNFMNAAFPDYYPSAAEAALKAGWAVATGHGLFQRSLLYEKDEEAVIVEALGKAEKFTGKRPRGWLGPGYGESFNTPDLLRKHGIEFLHDWMFDDMPCWMRTRHGPMMALPYALDLNDVMVFALERHTAEEYFIRFRDTVEYWEREDQPHVLTLGLHPHIIGVPYRMKAFERVLDYLLKRSDTIFMTSEMMFDWFKDQDPEGRKAVA